MWGKWVRRGAVIGTAYLTYEALYRASCMVSFQTRMAQDYDGKTLQDRQAYILDKQEALAFNYDHHMDKAEHKQQIDKVRQQLLQNVTGKVLETHVGTSRNLRYYHETVDLLGVDYSQVFLEQAQFKMPMHITPCYQLMDVNRMSLPDDTYDYVVDTFGLEYNINPEQALREMKRVCKPGGRILMINSGVGWKGEGWRDTLRVYALGLRSQYSVFHYGRFIDRDWGEVVDRVGGLEVERHDSIIGDSVQIYVLRQT